MSETPETPVVKKPKRPLPKSRVMLNALVDSIYKDAWEAEAKGEPVGWSTSIFPQELCATFGVPVLFPKMMGTPGAIKWPGQPLGKFNKEVYCDLLGYTEEQLDKLKEDGVI